MKVNNMNTHPSLNQMLETFNQEAGRASLVLLHPRSRYRSLLVAHLLNATDVKVFYYAFGPDDLNLQSFITGLIHDLSYQFPMFGRHINIIPQSRVDDPEALIEAMLLELTDLAAGREIVFILDEYDRGDAADDIQQFVERLIDRLPEGIRFVINGRTLPRLPWVSMIAQRRAVLLEDERLIAKDFYEIETQGKIKLEVTAFGPGNVYMNGKAIDVWEGHLPRLLFFFALDRPIVTRSEICMAFWPELSDEQAVNVFHVTKRRLHKALDMDVLVHDDGYYRVNPEMSIRFDVMDFVSALMAGRDEHNKNRTAAWQKAIDLYRGPFLQGHTDSWIADRRADYRAGYLEALTEMAHIRLGEERPEHALALFQRVLAEDISRVETHEQVMRLFTQMGRRSEAAAHFQRLTDEFKRAGVAVPGELTALYHEIVA
jgi:DNA-binding SARP family transcriptional activator